MAIVAPVERPPLDLEALEPEALMAEAEEVAEEEEVVEGVVGTAVVAGGAVDVITTMEGGRVPPVDGGDAVTVEVTATIDDCVVAGAT